MMGDARRTNVSAPGKVLITGGYLVLDSRFSGLVVAVDARFHVAVRWTKCSEKRGKLGIKVESPQFTNGSWSYEFDYSNGELEETPPPQDQTMKDGSRKNKFVQAALKYSLRYLANSNPQIFVEEGGQSLHITIQADNDFYSQLDHLQGRPATIDLLKSLPKFNTTLSLVENVKKTGLGSSAAMTTSLVFAILLHFGAVSESRDGISGVDLVHNLAQISHCFAQGKIGSGFDISSACYGSHIYNRFSPNMLEKYLGDVASSDFSANLAQRWDQCIKPVTLPPGFVLQLGDISAGSNTPKMVSKVLDWRKENLTLCESMWADLSSLSNLINLNLEKLCLIAKENNREYVEAFEKMSKTVMPAKCPVDATECEQSFLNISITFKKYRAIMKEMGIRSGVEIEPEQQTMLLDSCLDLPGVLAAAVPGAGGFDAVFCITLGKEVCHSVLYHWSKMAQVTPLLTSSSAHGLKIEKGDVN